MPGAIVHTHDVEDLCRVALLFADAPTAYQGAPLLTMAESIDALIALLADDAQTANQCADACACRRYRSHWSRLLAQPRAGLRILRSIDGVLSMPQGLSLWFARNTRSADEWDRTAHKVAQACYRLQSSAGRARLIAPQMGQRVFDFVEAFGGDGPDPSGDPGSDYSVDS